MRCASTVVGALFAASLGATVVVAPEAPGTPATTSAPATTPSSTTTSAPASQESEPVAVIRALLIAMAEMDEAAIRRVIVPDPDADALWEGPAVPAEHVAQMKQAFLALSVREVQAGEDVRLAGRRTVLHVTADMLLADRKLLQPELNGRPLGTPYWVERMDGSWKIDAGGLIAARIAGRAFRAQHGPPPTTQP